MLAQQLQGVDLTPQETQTARAKLQAAGKAKLASLLQVRFSCETFAVLSSPGALCFVACALVVAPCACTQHTNNLPFVTLHRRQPSLA